MITSDLVISSCPCPPGVDFPLFVDVSAAPEKEKKVGKYGTTTSSSIFCRRQRTEIIKETQIKTRLRDLHHHIIPLQLRRNMLTAAATSTGA